MVLAPCVREGLRRQLPTRTLDASVVAEEPLPADQASRLRRRIEVLRRQHFVRGRRTP